MVEFQVEFLKTLEDGVRLVPDLEKLEKVDQFKVSPIPSCLKLPLCAAAGYLVGQGEAWHCAAGRVLIFQSSEHPEPCRTSQWEAC